MVIDGFWVFVLVFWYWEFGILDFWDFRYEDIILNIV